MKRKVDLDVILKRVENSFGGQFEAESLRAVFGAITNREKEARFVFHDQLYVIKCGSCLITRPNLKSVGS